MNPCDSSLIPFCSHERGESSRIEGASKVMEQMSRSDIDIWGHLLSPNSSHCRQSKYSTEQMDASQPQPLSAQLYWNASAGLRPRGETTSTLMSAWDPQLLRNAEIWEPSHFWAQQAGTGAASALYLDQRLYLAEGVLTKIDRATSFGVEYEALSGSSHRWISSSNALS